MAEAGTKSGLGFDPMHQFEVSTLVELPMLQLPYFGAVDVSFTNASLWMVLAVSLASLFMMTASSRSALVPGRLQLLGEMSYTFIANMIRQNVGTEGMRYFPFIFSLFMFILFCNLLGMIPYSFTVTSHLIVTFAMAAFVFLMVTFIGFMRHGIGFLKIFVPSGIPLVLLPLLVVIELISYLTRPVSLSVRLFGNMMAGHTMLKVFGGFVVGLSTAGLIPLAIAPFALMVAFTGLELLIAALQAYVFTILTCIYLNDAIHMNH
ncbi:MAG: F0F1 ATP synthase subunit A [Alphaproteobacteria bacterium]|nr:F0F1 ATP synthase subunit A [Alphaproteobacteria bacterium]MBE8219853.1 F0F1 ATP synthase subunit A [Alphaproteobacteria bacterium]